MPPRTGSTADSFGCFLAEFFYRFLAEFFYRRLIAYCCFSPIFLLGSRATRTPIWHPRGSSVEASR
jgi:hypothetical protein